MDREPNWAEVVRHCEDEIARLQRLLEAIQPEAATNQVRGEIRAFRRMLEFGRPQAPEPPDRMIQPTKTTY